MNLVSPAPAAAPSAPGPARGRDGWLRAAIIGGSLLLWLLACRLPAMSLREVPAAPAVVTWSGGGALAAGWLGASVLQFAWCANPVLPLALALVFFRRWAAAAAVSGLALVLGLDTLTLYWQGVPNADSPQTLYLARLLPGYFVWLASFALVVACCLVRWRRPAARNP